MIIFIYLHHHDILYSFININKRFDSIISNAIIGKKLTLISSNDSSFPFNDTIFDRICEILPKFYDNIQWINLESSITERILLSTNYSKLKALVLYLSSQTVIDLFADTSFLFEHFGQQIETLINKAKPIVAQIDSLDSFDDDQILEDRKIFQFLFKQCCTIPGSRKRPVNGQEVGLQFLNISDSIIDGDILKKDFINHMPRLNKFTFNISSLVRLDNPRNLPSNEDIKNTFKNFNNIIISSVDYFSQPNLLYCHIYSYPYTWTFYHNITNDFPGRLFKCVRRISLRDEHPFEHDFFSSNC
ncbi:unnamed protein product [Rotaria sp. Silwood2]|nr:unnamed protein product [Rotaria sp. Silwood2]CAF4448871.1 unnamed protein product [Rotaria sp. Silwood2]